MRKTAATCLIALLAVAGSGCIQHEGQLTVFLTRAQGQGGQNTQTAPGGIRQVNLGVTTVELLVPDKKAFVTLSRGLQTFELMGLGGRGGLLAIADSLTRGNYSQLRLTFSAADSFIVDERGRQQPLAVQPVTIAVPTLISIVEDASTEVNLEIDLNASLAQKGNGNWILRPVLRQGTQNGR